MLFFFVFSMYLMQLTKIRDTAYETEDIYIYYKCI